MKDTAISYAVMIAFLLIAAVCMCQGCVSNHQNIDITGPLLGEMPKGSDCRMLVIAIGTQLAARPTDLGILNPNAAIDANAAASQNGNANAKKSQGPKASTLGEPAVLDLPAISPDSILTTIQETK